MNRPSIIVGLALVLFAGTVGSGCASTPRAGQVIMQASAIEAHLLLPAGGASVGDKVAIYRDVHTGARHRPVDKRFIGEGTVTRLMGEKYAVVEVAPGVEFREGDYAERK